LLGQIKIKTRIARADVMSSLDSSNRCEGPTASAAILILHRAEPVLAVQSSPVKGGWQSDLRFGCGTGRCVSWRHLRQDDFRLRTGAIFAAARLILQPAQVSDAAQRLPLRPDTKRVFARERVTPVGHPAQGIAVLGAVREPDAALSDQIVPCVAHRPVWEAAYTPLSTRLIDDLILIALIGAIHGGRIRNASARQVTFPRWIGRRLRWRGLSGVYGQLGRVCIGRSGRSGQRHSQQHS